MKHCTSATLSLVCLLLACHCIDVQAGTAPQESTEHSTVESKVKRPLPTLIVAGQSNAFRLGRLARGKGVSADAKFYHFANPNCVKASDLNARVRMFSGDQKLGGSGAGIVQALGAEHPEGFAVICYAVCGSNLHTQWMPTKPDGHYQKYFDPFVAKGLKEIEQASGRKPKVVGMLWHQGESNSGSPAEVDAYARLMPAVTANFRKSYGQVPIVLGEIREFDDQPNRAAINEHMHTIAKHESGVGVVELQDAGWESPTNVHFSGKGASVAGWRLVAEWKTQQEVLARLRGCKISGYEGGSRVPMMVRWPGRTPEHQRTNAPIIVEDINPTILEMAGVASDDQQIDGKSFVEILDDPSIDRSQRPLFWHYPNLYHLPPYSSVRLGDHKLIYWHLDQRIEVFDLSNDIGETNDLKNEQPDLTRQLATLLSEHLHSTKAQLLISKETGKPIPMPTDVLASQPKRQSNP